MCRDRDIIYSMRRVPSALNLLFISYGKAVHTGQIWFKSSLFHSSTTPGSDQCLQSSFFFDRSGQNSIVPGRRPSSFCYCTDAVRFSFLGIPVDMHNDRRIHHGACEVGHRDLGDIRSIKSHFPCLYCYLKQNVRVSILFAEWHGN